MDDTEISVASLLDKMSRLDQSSGQKIGAESLESLTVNLSTLLGAEVALIGLLNDDRSRVQAFCTIVDGKAVDNVEYGIRGTPCEYTIGDDGYFCREGVIELFPDDDMLKDVAAVSYVGTCLFDENDSPIGLIALTGRKALDHPEVHLEFLRRISSRVSSELQLLLQKKELETHRDHLELILDSSGTVFIEHDFKEPKITVSPQFWRLLDHPDQATSFHPDVMMELIHPDDRTFHSEHRSTTIAGQEGFTTEFRVRTGDGSYKWIEYRGISTNGANGIPISIRGILSDISRKKEIETRLERVNKRYELAISATGVGVWEVDMTDNTTFASEELCQILTLDRNTDPRLSSVIERVHPDDQHYIFEATEKLKTQGETQTIEYRIQRDDGQYIWVRNRSQTENDAQGRIIRIAGIIEDITDWKKQEVELEENYHRLEEQNEKLRNINQQIERAHRTRLEYENRFKRAVEASGGYIYESDGAGVSTYLSSRFEEITGYSPYSMIGQNISNLVREDYRAQTKEKLRTIARNQTTVRDMELPLIHKNGHTIWINLTVAPYYDLNGNLIGFCGSGTDISERKERDIELDQARNAAEQANRAKSHFLASMSHEIRTPMNGVLGMAHNLRNTELSENQQQLVTTIIESGGILLNLLNGILDISKIEANQLELEHIEFRPDEIFTKCRHLWAPIFAEKKIDFRIEHDGVNHLNVLGDPTRFYQILQNLLGNALKFTHSGSVVMRAEVRSENDKDVVLYVRVDDTGIGIDEQSQSILFDRFTQADSTVARKYGGSGLGLSICQELVHLMGGAIGVESRVGDGARFWFTVQLDKAAPRSRTSAQSSQSPSLAEQPQFDGTTRILVAEDNAVNQRVIKAFLQIVGLHADMANNGQEAVDMAANEKYDLILMDIQMPELDGLEATSRIQEIDQYQNVPIVALTANASLEDQRFYLASGMNDYIAKPIEPKQLYEIIGKYVPVAELIPEEDDRESLDLTDLPETGTGTGTGKM